MKITINQLRRIIKEEVEKTLDKGKHEVCPKCKKPVGTPGEKAKTGAVGLFHSPASTGTLKDWCKCDSEED